MPDRVEIVRGDASRVDELEPLWLAMREAQTAGTEAWGPPRDPAEGWAKRSADYRAILEEGGTLLLAVLGDGTVVGHAICEQEAWRSPTWTWPSSVLALVDLSVAADHRSRGVGARLLAAVEEEGRARGVDALDLMVAAPNAGARRFYAHHGFTEDLVVCRKRLD